LVIVLSEHVDYWDRLGWRDPFSSTLYTQRQEAYGRRLHLDSVYTARVVIEGTLEAVGSDARQISAAIGEAIKEDKVRVQISSVFKNSRGVSSVEVRVDPSEKFAARGGAKLMLALAENTVVSHVLRGENSGRKLDHVAVVQSLTLTELGHVDPAGVFSAAIPLTGELEHWNGKRLIAFVQDQQEGRIQGAAFRLLSSTTSN
jgi:hypothetical protein